jgi:hypothetical protein
MTTLSYPEPLGAPQQGRVTFDLKDARTGKQLDFWVRDNLVTLDAGILAARLFKNTELPTPGRNNGLNMLSVGTGGVALLNTQRKLEAELVRKAFTSTTYIDAGGAPTAIPTNVVDFEVIFGALEAVGALNEMGLMHTANLNPAVWNQINNGPVGYDPTIDVTTKDLMANYLSWAPASVKPPFSILTVTWRVEF